MPILRFSFYRYKEMIERKSKKNTFYRSIVTINCKFRAKLLWLCSKEEQDEREVGGCKFVDVVSVSGERRGLSQPPR